LLYGGLRTDCGQIERVERRDAPFERRMREESWLREAQKAVAEMSAWRALIAARCATLVRVVSLPRERLSRLRPMKKIGKSSS